MLRARRREAVAAAHGRLVGAGRPARRRQPGVFSPPGGRRRGGGSRGWATHAALLTPSGYRLNAFKLPGKPVAALLVVDVDGDGLNDVVARTAGGDVYAWRQRSHPGLAPFTFLLGALAVAVAAAFVTQMSTTDEAGRIVRSTDVDEHESAKDR